MKKYLSLFLLLPFLFFMSCELFDSGSDKDDDDDDDNNTEQVSGLQFNISGAKALAGGSSSSSGVEMSRSARTAMSADLVKILEDGTIEAALSFGDDNYSWTPNISFMSVGEDGSVYICFESMYSEWNYDETDGSSSTTYLQFVRVYPDNTYDVLWPHETDSDEYPSETIQTWTWYTDMDMDPLVKDSSGNIYFMTQSWTNSKTVNHIYKYSPSSGGSPVRVTPANSTMTIDTFKVDSNSNLYIKSGWSTSDSWMRCYLSGETTPQNIYFTSTNDTWIRGYNTAPTGSALIINGYNVRGMSGIIKATVSSGSNPEIDLLYSTNSSSWVSLAMDTDYTWDNPTSLMNYTYTYNQATYSYDYTFSWDNDVLSDSNVVEDKILQRIQPYYIGAVTLKSEPSASGWDLDASPIASDGGFTFSTVGEWIKDQPEDFLKTCFTGTMMKDWLANNNLSYFSFDYIQNMIYDTAGNLYGVYFDYSGTGNKIVKLLNSAGDRNLSIISSAHGEDKPSMIKFIGNYMYYRYSVMDASGYETGYNKLARLDITSSSDNNDEEILTDSFFTGKNLQILTYDVADDNSVMYFSALDYFTNEVIFGKVDLTTMTYSDVDYSSTFSEITVF